MHHRVKEEKWTITKNKNDYSRISSGNIILFVDSQDIISIYFIELFHWDLRNPTVRKFILNRRILLHQDYCHRNNYSVLSHINTNDKQNNRRVSLGQSLTAFNDALNATLQRSLFFFKWAKIGSVFEKIIGPYEVYIFVNIGYFKDPGALPVWNTWPSCY